MYYHKASTYVGSIGNYIYPVHQWPFMEIVLFRGQYGANLSKVGIAGFFQYPSMSKTFSIDTNCIMNFFVSPISIQSSNVFLLKSTWSLPITIITINSNLIHRCLAIGFLEEIF